MHRCSRGLATLSAERVRLEMLKADGRRRRGWRRPAMWMAVLLPIFGGRLYRAFEAMISAERTLGLAPDPGAPSARWRSPSPRMPNGWRCACDDQCRDQGTRFHGPSLWRLAGMDEATARRRLYRLGEDRYRDRLLLAWARSGDHADVAAWRQLATLPERWSAPKFSAEGCRFHRARSCPRPPARAGACVGGGRLARAGFSARWAALKAIADQAVTRITRDDRP